MKLLTSILFFLPSFVVFAQTEMIDTAYVNYWSHLDAEFKNPETSPLESSKISGFDSIPRYAFDPNYRIEASFRETERSKPFKMKATGSISQTYVKTGELHFIIEEDSLQLSVYRNLDLERTRPGEEFIFVPFTDQTNGITTYGGGRYLDFNLSQSEVQVLDFNRAYNPYCAYNYNYSCPIPPAENNLKIEIPAGARAD